MNDPVETFDHFGLKVEIFYDEDPLDPRTDFDHPDNRMLCWHQRASLGDEQFPGGVPDEQDLKQWLHDTNPRVWRWLWLYEHGGMTMSIGPRNVGLTASNRFDWDAGRVGVIYATDAMIREAHLVSHITGKVIDRVHKNMEADVAEYDQYLTGQVFGYRINQGVQEVDSCWGFFGLDYCIAEAKGAAEWLAKEQAAEEAEFTVACDLPDTVDITPEAVWMERPFRVMYAPGATIGFEVGY